MTDDSAKPVADLALIATFAALVAVCSVTAALPIGVNGVPITLQTFAVLMCGAVLGSKRGFLAVLLYLAVGLAGLPVFAAGMAGLAPFAGPTGGYLLSFPFAAALIGLFVGRGHWQSAGSKQTGSKQTGSKHTGMSVSIVAGGLLAEAVMFAAGAAGIMVYAGLSASGALTAAALYIPGDLLKLAAVTIFASSAHRAFPTLAYRS